MSPVFQSWQNENRYRAYPFREDTDLASTAGPDVSVPNDFIVDMSVSIPAITDSDGFFPAETVGVRMSGLMYGEPRAVLFFSLETGEDFATAVVPDLDSHKPGDSYPISGLGEYGDVSGHVVIGTVDGLRETVPEGSYSFGGCILEMSVIHPSVRGVRSLKVGTGTALSDPVYGIVKLIEGTNVRLTYNSSDNSIRFDAVDSAGFSETCPCSEASETSVIKTINGVSVSDLRIEGDDCVEVDVSGNTIQIRDKCSFPCCGCRELDHITSRLQIADAALKKVESIATTLQSVVPASIAAIKMAVKTQGTVSISDNVVV